MNVEIVDLLAAIGIATAAWFVAAAALFFNPPVDKMYNSEAEHPSVKVLPKNGGTIGKILLAVIVQCSLWAVVWVYMRYAMPNDMVKAGIMFGGIIVVMKLIPRDIDRLLLTTYPSKRMTIEFIVGVICAFVVGFVYAWYLPAY